MSDELQDCLQQYFEVASSYRGKGSPLTVKQGLDKLRPIVHQTLSPSLAMKAAGLTRRIILGGRRVDLLEAATTALTNTESREEA
jgi:hypothetical protein